MSRVHWQVEDVTASVSNRTETAAGEVVRATWTVTVTLTADGRHLTAGMLLTDLESRLAHGTIRTTDSREGD